MSAASEAADEIHVRADLRVRVVAHGKQLALARGSETRDVVLITDFM